MNRPTRPGFLSILALVLIGLAGPAQAVDFNNGWVSQGVAVNNGYLWNPEVVRLTDGTLRMYVEDHGRDINSSLGTVLLVRRPGRSWVRLGRVFMANHPAVVQLDDGRWRLYFQKNDPQTNQSGVGSAVSGDGIHFLEESGLRLLSRPALEGAAVRHPCVVGLPGGGFRMYYDTDARNGAFMRIWSARSSNGLTFTREGLRLDVTRYRSDWPSGFYAHASKPEVLRTPDGVWWMYFNCSPLQGSVYGGINLNLATSTNGLAWTVRTEPEVRAAMYPDNRLYSPFDPSVQVVASQGRSYLQIWFSTFLSPAEGFVGRSSALCSAMKPLDNLAGR